MIQIGEDERRYHNASVITLVYLTLLIMTNDV
jgi:hypothetical protein